MSLAAIQKRLQKMSERSGLLRAPTPPLAIDFGVSSLKILQITPGDPPALVSAVCLDTPTELRTNDAERLVMQMGVLPRLVKSGGFTTRRAVCSIPASQTFVKHLQIARVDGVAMRAQVEQAVAAQLGCDPSALLVRHIEVKTDTALAGNRMEVIAMATPRELVTRLMSAAKAARLELVGVHSELAAMLRAFDPITRRGEDEQLTSLYLDIGLTTSKVAIARGRSIIFARVIECGGLAFDKAVAAQLKISVEEARAMRHEAVKQDPIDGQTKSLLPLDRNKLRESLGSDREPLGALADRRLGAAAPPGSVPAENAGAEKPEFDLTEPLEILTDEIQLCLRYYETLFPGRKVDRVLFVGGVACDRALCERIARKLRLSAHIADPLARISRTGKEPCVNVDVSSALPGWAVALGLCQSPTDL